MRKAINLAVIEDKHLLLVKKDKTWILPGGKPEFGESPFACLLREFKEELPDSRVYIGNYYHSFIGKTPYRGDNLEAKVYFGGLLGLPGEPSSEISDVRFIKNFEKYNLSDITNKIINSLKKDNYL